MPDVVVGREATGFEVGTRLQEDRQRLIDAATRAAVEFGYEGLEIEQIAGYAGLSEDDFHFHFHSKDQCLLAAYDSFIERLLEHIDEACETAGDWPGKVKASIESAFEFVAELEAVARLFVVDAPRFGTAGVERRWASIDLATLRLKQGRRLFPVAADFPEMTERTLVSGVVMLASAHLLAEDATVLPALEAEAVELVLTPYVGSREARRVATA